MESNNRSQDSVKVIWEILPGDVEEIFREISQEEFDPSLFSSGLLVSTDNFPLIPHPLLNPAEDCLNRVWTQSFIKIGYKSSESFGGYGS